SPSRLGVTAARARVDSGTTFRSRCSTGLSAVRKKYPEITTPVVTRNAAIVKISSMTSHLNLDDTAHHEMSGDQTAHAVQEQQLPVSALHHGAEVGGIVDEHERADDKGESGQHETRQPSLCRQHLDVALQLRALADGVRDVV